MQEDLKELRLPSGARGRALRQAQLVLSQSQQANPAGPDHGEALEEAFAEFVVPPRRTDRKHQADNGAGLGWNARDSAQQIAAQLKQLDDQRRHLAELLESLDVGE